MLYRTSNLSQSVLLRRPGILNKLTFGILKKAVDSPMARRRHICSLDSVIFDFTGFVRLGHEQGLDLSEFFNVLFIGGFSRCLVVLVRNSIPLPGIDPHVLELCGVPQLPLLVPRH